MNSEKFTSIIIYNAVFILHFLYFFGILHLVFEAFSIGPFLIWTRVVFLLVGIWLSAEFFFRLAQSAHLSLSHFRDHAWRYVFAFLLVSRIVAVLSNYRVYIKDPMRLLIFWDGGFSLLGGAIGVGIVIYWATHTQRSTFLQWLDVLLPATCFGMAFEWLGKFFAGISYGKPTDAFWGVVYDTIGVRYVVPVHPVQLYYAFFFFFLTFALLLVRKHSKRAGAETLLGVLLAAFVTFGLEYFRGDFSIPVFATQLDFVVLVAMFISLGVFAAIEVVLSKRALLISQLLLFIVFGGYMVARGQLLLPTYQLRFSQFLSVLAALAVVVYVVVHRRKHPHL